MFPAFSPLKHPVYRLPLDPIIPVSVQPGLAEDKADSIIQRHFSDENRWPWWSSEGIFGVLDWLTGWILRRVRFALRQYTYPLNHSSRESNERSKRHDLREAGPPTLAVIRGSPNPRDR